MPQRVDISVRSILLAFATLLLLWFLFIIRDIILLVFLSFILMSAFLPWVEFLEKKRFPRIIGVLLLYIVLIGVILISGGSIVPILINESVRLSHNLPEYARPFLPMLKVDNQTITQQLAPFGENLVRLTFGIFGNLFSLFTIIIISFYLLLERKNIPGLIMFYTTKSRSDYFAEILNKIEQRLGAWVRGQLSLMISVGILTFIPLLIFQIPYALPLAILAGILEIVPIIGPIISAVPAVLVAIPVSPFMWITVSLIYLVVQLVENNVIIPIVMQKAVGLSPVVVIVALMIGARLAGITGAILSVPIVVTFETILSEYLHKR